MKGVPRSHGRLWSVRGAQVAFWMRIVGKMGGQGEARGLVRARSGGRGTGEQFSGDGGLPWCPVAKTLHFQCRERGFEPWLVH